MNTSPIPNEKKKKKASGISCMNPYPMKMKKSKMNFKYEQQKFMRKCSQILISNIYNPSVMH